MSGAGGDRREAAWDEETDEAFLERIDALVMAEWCRLRREGNLSRLHDDYGIRTEFLSALQDLLAAHQMAGGIAALPTRAELRRWLIAVRQKRLGREKSDPPLTAADPTADEWELPEEDPQDEWCLPGCIAQTPAVEPTP
jgi:hypothetical protein